MIRPAPIVVLFLVVQAGAARAREVATGRAVELAVHEAEYEELYWVQLRGDDSLQIVSMPAQSRPIARAIDLVDERGFVARLKVSPVQVDLCGGESYTVAEASVPWLGLGRELVGGVVALGPARGRHPPARVLAPGTEAEALPGRLVIDLDGDGLADLARQVVLGCAGERGVSAACITTWRRDGGAWRRVVRTELGPCD